MLRRHRQGLSKSGSREKIREAHARLRRAFLSLVVGCDEEPLRVRALAALASGPKPTLSGSCVEFDAVVVKPDLTREEREYNLRSRNKEPSNRGSLRVVVVGGRV
jgi:hypothetical protein